MSLDKPAVTLKDPPLYMISSINLATLSFLSLPVVSIILIRMHLGVFLFGFLLPDSPSDLLNSAICALQVWKLLS